LGRQHRVFKRRRIAPHPAPAILGIPHIRHVAPSAPLSGFGLWTLIINDLPHCSKYIVQCTHNKFNARK
jgi:hypothetical protein